MAIPGNKLSSEPVVAPYIDPDGRTYSLNEDWEAGPKYVNDTSEGLFFQPWHLTYAEAAGYNPPVMQYDGSTGYYEADPITTSGNKFTLTARIKIATFTGATTQKALIQVQGDLSINRVSLAVRSSDWSTADQQGKLLIFIADNVGATSALIFSNASILDDTLHTIFIAYDGDAGTLEFIIDGVANDDVAVAARVAPTTGILDEGTSSLAILGYAFGSPAGRQWPGQIGYVGYHDVYLTNWQDFMENDGSPKQLDETGWTEWGSQPLFWNDGGKMDENKGSAGNMTQNGIITPVVFPSGGTFTITPEDEGAPYVVLSGQNSVQCTFAFDNNARPTIAWVDDTDQGYLYWYSSVANDFIITEVATPVVGIALTLDDKRITQQQANDILAWYTLPTGSGDQHILYMRRQRDRYIDIYEMLNPAWPYIHKCGMNEVNRVQLDLSTEAPA